MSAPANSSTTSAITARTLTDGGQQPLEIAREIVEFIGAARSTLDLAQYDFNLADITEVWRRGSVIASWLLDLTAAAFAKSPDLTGFAGRVADSGEGRWTVMAAIDESVPAPVLSSALYERFGSRGEGDFAFKVLSAMRFGFGGHVEKE